MDFLYLGKKNAVMTTPLNVKCAFIQCVMVTRCSALVIHQEILIMYGFTHTLGYEQKHSTGLSFYIK